MMQDRTRFVLLALSLFWGCNGRPVPPSATGTSTSQAVPNPKVVSLGRLEPRSGVVSIGALPGQRLKSLSVREGELVTKDQILGELASYEARKAEVDAIRNRLKVAPNRWQRKLEVARARLKQANAAVGRAQASLEEVKLQARQVPLLLRKANRAEETYSTLLNLQAQDASLVTQRELERYALVKDTASIDYELANERSALGKRTAEEVLNAAKADVEAAQAALKEVEESNPEPEIRDQLEIAEIGRKLVELRAPIDGQIVKVFARPGEILVSTPILQIADLEQMVCIAEVYEADAHKICAEKLSDSQEVVLPGDRARVMSKAFSGRFAEDGIWGTVEHVGSLVAPPGIQSRNPLAQADRAVVEVRIRVDSDQTEPQNGELNKAANPFADERAANGTEDRRTDSQQAAQLIQLQVKVEFYDANQTEDLAAQP